MLDFAAGNRNAARPAPVTGVDDILDDPDDRRHVIVTHTVGGGYGSVTARFPSPPPPRRIRLAPRRVLTLIRT